MNSFIIISIKFWGFCPKLHSLSLGCWKARMAARDSGRSVGSEPPEFAESWNKKLKKRMNSWSTNATACEYCTHHYIILFRYMDLKACEFYCPDLKAPNPIKLRGNGQCQRCCFCLDLLTRDDPTATDDEDDEDIMPELIDVSS